MECKRLFKFEIIGVLVIFALGSLWHSLYEFSNENMLIGLIAPINESVWEHWKLGLYPILIYSAIEYIFVRKEAKNFLFSKFIGILVFDLVCFSIIALWNLFFKDSSGTTEMIVDIVAYLIGILIGQTISYVIACITLPNKKLRYIAIVGIVIHIIVFIIFTFKPPMREYFKDKKTGEHGIYKLKY
ncbi:DUF6512 family protein [Clostridium sp. AL.422]|uniref:DUF6512 family protein n=1 Tax=Clostridium TaxID=1485 RepID=UPI00293DAB36|nr:MULTISPECIES: DUF6512 family protein [unclassified Clostridium]MDV4150855.1 DUF6512 family protein [Clostridium sp. AL.422]